jgi:CRISPR-associated protein Csb2
MLSPEADTRVAPLAAKALLQAIMAGYRSTGQEKVIPQWVSGHEADGSPSKQPHLAAVPLAFVGFEHADGALKGMGLVPPRGLDPRRERDFVAAVRAIAPIDAATGLRTIDLWAVNTGQDRIHVRLAIMQDELAASLDPARYAGSSRLWATATPLVLDRHLNAVGHSARQSEIEAQVKSACVKIGLPEPRYTVADKHPAVAGAVSAAPSGQNPAWMRWRVPASFRTRHLTHAVIEFEEPVIGPILVGAGRYCGLGLCLPLDDGLLGG